MGDTHTVALLDEEDAEALADVETLAEAQVLS